MQLLWKPNEKQPELLPFWRTNCELLNGINDHWRKATRRPLYFKICQIAKVTKITKEFSLTAQQVLTEKFSERAAKKQMRFKRQYFIE
jgi:hypothetical protein